MTVEKTKVNYKPLWKLLIDKELSKAELRKKTSIARSTIVKMANNEYVSMDVLVRICIALDCGMDDIVEIEREDGGKQNG
ncbi:MAG: helix-turn-helix transcriptional regulator [Clostridiales bacterium]|nr:helix-turn-helix transcriptional regulator [Clostridiales bacterium]MDY3745488.1 helix-turn-helix transcriptional regulator [Lachnospiraceae bacterium]